MKLKGSGKHYTVASLQPHLLLVDAEDGTNGDVAVNVGGAVEGIEGTAVLAVVGLRDNDGLGGEKDGGQKGRRKWRGGC
jgi:hypothetical protein